MTNNPPSSAYLALQEVRRYELSALILRALSGPRPFVLEVGCGHGHYLTAYAEANPEKTCIGVDRVGERIARAQRKRERAKLANLHFIRAEIGQFFQTLPAEFLYSELFILFPDPWPKMRHHKHRILQPTFLTLAANHATTDCRLCFRTDFEPYFNEASAVVDQHERWRRVEEPWPFEYETVFQHRATSHQSLIARLRP